MFRRREDFRAVSSDSAMLDVLAAPLGVKGSSGSEDDDSIRRLAVLASLIAAIFDPIEGAVPAAAGAAAAGAWTGVLDMPSRALPSRPYRYRCNRGGTSMYPGLV